MQNLIRKYNRGIDRESTTLGMTFGVFDLFHIGHLRYLNYSKGLADHLCVGIDSDFHTKFRKGVNRPICDESHRMEIVGNLNSVDSTFLIRDADYLYDFIGYVRPDIIILSETTDNAPEFISHCEKNCSELYMLPAQSEITTSGIIKRVVHLSQIGK